MISQASWIYKIIQFKVHKNVRFFIIKIRETKRETFFADIKCYWFASEQIRNFIQDHEIVSKNAG